MSRKLTFIQATVLATLVFLAFGAPQVQAQSSYFLDIFYNGNLVTTSSNSPLVLQQGIPATLTVHLREQTSSGQSSELANSGLFGGGVRATFDNSGSKTFRLDSASASSAITVNPGFDTVARNVQSTFAQFEANVGFSRPYLFPNAQNRIELGSFTFQTPNIGLEQIQFSDLPTPETFVFGDSFAQFDNRVAGNTVFVNIVPVPEPGAILGLSCVAFALAATARRCRAKTRNPKAGLR